MSKVLVLHFDVNGTITAVDTTDTHTTHNENANVIISKNVYGKLLDDGHWKCLGDKGTLSYYDYVKQYHCKTLAYQFTNDSSPGHPFKHFLKPITDSLQGKPFFFQSFQAVIQKYPDAVYIFRTFGLDSNTVVNELKNLHPNVNAQFLTTKDLVFQDLNKAIIVSKETTSDNTLTAIVIQEDYTHWNNNGRSPMFGKQFVGHPQLDQIFFDDNDCVNVVDNAGPVIKVNTISAAIDENYFNSHIKRSFKV